MSNTFGNVSAHASATCAGVQRKRVAIPTTSGVERTAPAPAAPEPSGENGTNAMFRRLHSSSTDWDLRFARWKAFWTQANSVNRSACSTCASVTLLRPIAAINPSSRAEIIAASELVVEERVRPGCLASAGG